MLVIAPRTAGRGRVMFERAALPRTLPFVTYIFFIFIADLSGRLGYSAEQLQLLYPLKIAAVLAVLLLHRRHYIELAWQRPRASALLLAGSVGVVVFVLWITLNANWMTIGSSVGYDPRRDGAIVWPLVLVRIVGAALVVPVMEELFWRSFLMRWIVERDFLRVTPRNVKFKSFVVTVILFGFEHNLWLAGIVAGLAYSVIYMRSSNLWLSVFAHAVTNGLLGVWIVCTAQWTYW